MGSIKTVDEALKLREVKDEFYHIETYLDELGVLHRTCKPKKLSAYPVEGDDILFFKDVDGRLMKIGYDDDGPYKTEFFG